MYLWIHALDSVNDPCLKVITVVREPIIQQTSATFQNLRDIPHFIGEDGSLRKEVIKDNLYKAISNNFSQRTIFPRSLNWFDEEFKSALKIDVYKYEFNHFIGYTVISTKNIDVLILRVENSEIWSKAISEFLNLKYPLKMIRVNVSSNKDYGKTYKEIASQLRFPASVLDNIYSSKYCQHFYTQEMISEFIKKWSI